MKEWNNYKPYKYYDQANNKQEQRYPVHAIHKFYIGIISRLRIAFLNK
jgi:hypothetical protein